MTPSNFNWFLHVMLFYHTRHVKEQQNIKKTSGIEEEEDKEETEDIGDNIDWFILTVDMDVVCFLDVSFSHSILNFCQIHKT